MTNLVQIDSRGRISLSKHLLDPHFDRFIVTRHEDGVSLILTPCKIVPISALGGTT